MLQLPRKLRDSKQPKAGPRDGQIPHKGWSKGRHQGGSEGDPGGAALAEPVPELETNQCPAKPLTAHSPVSLTGVWGGWGGGEGAGATDQVEIKGAHGSTAHILDQGTSGCCSGVLLLVQQNSGGLV